MKSRASERGDETERRYVEWLRDHGWHEAKRYGANQGLGGRGDVLGVGSRIIEIKNTPWTRVPEELRKPERDARKQGVGEFWLWRHVRRSVQGEYDPEDFEPGSVSRSVMIGRAEVVWPLLAELDELRKQAGR